MHSWEAAGVLMGCLAGNRGLPGRRAGLTWRREPARQLQFCERGRERVGRRRGRKLRRRHQPGPQRQELVRELRAM
jgi:hypothetical protein